MGGVNIKKELQKDCAHIEVFQNNYKQRLLQQAITMKSGYFNEVSGFFFVILFSILLSLKTLHNTPMSFFRILS